MSCWFFADDASNEPSGETHRQQAGKDTRIQQDFVASSGFSAHAPESSRGVLRDIGISVNC